MGCSTISNKISCREEDIPSFLCTIAGCTCDIHPLFLGLLRFALQHSTISEGFLFEIGGMDRCLELMYEYTICFLTQRWQDSWGVFGSQ